MTSKCFLKNSKRVMTERTDKNHIKNFENRSNYNSVILPMVKKKCKNILVSHNFTFGVVAL